MMKRASSLLLATQTLGAGAACVLPADTADLKSRCVQLDGLERCWMTLRPSSSAALPNKPRLIMDLHGYTSCANEIRAYSGWQKIAEKNGLVIVWPQGTESLAGQLDAQPSWNAGPLCCGGSSAADIDDVAFLRMVVESTDGVDQSNVYMAGHSNGCAMAQRMAAEASDIVAAVGCHAMYLVTGEPPPQTYSAVPIMEIHGQKDAIVGFNDYYLTGIGAQSNAQSWAALNGCNASPATSPAAGSDPAAGITVTEYSDCVGGASVALVTMPDADHGTVYSDSDACKACAVAVTCYSEQGCQSQTNLVWGGLYVSCNGGAAACASCFADSPCGVQPSGSDTSFDSTELAWQFIKRFPLEPATPAPTPAPTTSGQGSGDGEGGDQLTSGACSHLALPTVVNLWLAFALLATAPTVS